jgi:3-hydroxyacyl-CoA dehydrogenase/enoyl-CoA hydratase/3-hydroxybutyryl-CoA epimerase
MGIDAFEARCAQLAERYGPGFTLSDAVKSAIRKFVPVY